MHLRDWNLLRQRTSCSLSSEAFSALALQLKCSKGSDEGAVEVEGQEVVVPGLPSSKSMEGERGERGKGEGRGQLNRRKLNGNSAQIVGSSPISRHHLHMQRLNFPLDQPLPMTHLVLDISPAD